MTDPHLDLMDDARHAEAVADRSRRRLIAEADDQDATFAGSLRAAAEAGGPVVVDTTVGRTVRGRIDAVSSAHVVITDATATSYVRVDQVTAVRAAVGAPRVRATPVDDHIAPSSLVDLLTGLAHQRSPVDVHLVGGAVVRGDVRRIGADVLTVSSRTTTEETLVNLALTAVLTVHRGPS